MGQKLWPVICTFKEVKLPTAKTKMCDFLNHIGGWAP